MQMMDQTDFHEVEISTLAQSEHELKTLQQHLREIIEGPAFKSSRRCGLFLKFIIDQSIAGHFDSLKERMIGVELFGRSPSYDTGGDAIVRVAASEVRRRLLQHYGEVGTASEYCLSLPLGSYIPTVRRRNHTDTALIEPLNESDEHAASQREVRATDQTAGNHAQEPASQSSVCPPGAAKSTGKNGLRWLLSSALALAVALNIGLWVSSRSSLPLSVNPLSYLPWSMLFRSTNPTVLITSDPNIAEIQAFTGGEISVSDYANHNYLSGPNKLTPEEERICRDVLQGDKAASIDTPIAVSIGELAQVTSRKLIVRSARHIQLSDLKTDDDLILLGSPRSDPWSGLFDDQLNFKIIYDKEAKQEVIFNAHPWQNEPTTYVPTAPGGATGQSYAIVAFVQNPDSNGRVLLLAGVNGEGTTAAGQLVTDLPRLSQALRQCGLQGSRTGANFEMLLRLKTMAGSPSHVDVIACHILGPSNAH
jgi:hypothetical protein